MNQRKAIEAALAEMGITNETQLNDAIRNMKPLNLSLMADRQQERKARRQRKRTSEILLAIFTLTNCGTLQELEYHAGYYAGTADQAAAVGEITREQRGQILRVLHYISAGERERLENE